MSSIGSTPTFAKNNKFDRTNWASWRRLIRLAANQRGAMGYLEGSIKQPVMTNNTSTPGKATTLPAPATPTKTPWSFTSLSLEEWTNRDTWTMGLLLFNTKDAVGRGINIDGTAAEAWQSYIDIYENASAMARQNAMQDLRNTLYTDHTDFDLFITTL